MVTHVPLGPEALTASLRALEGSLVDMDPHVDAQILFLTEGFTASWESTLEGLRPVVQMQVCVETEFTRERLEASTLRADVSGAVLL